MLRFSECCTGKRSSVPESFRGGCSFGGQHAGSLPLIAEVNLPWFAAELCCSGVRSDSYGRPVRHRPVLGIGIQHRDARAHGHAPMQVDDVLVEEPDAPAGDRMADCFGSCVPWMR